MTLPQSRRQGGLNPSGVEFTSPPARAAGRWSASLSAASPHGRTTRGQGGRDSLGADLCETGGGHRLSPSAAVIASEAEALRSGPRKAIALTRCGLDLVRSTAGRRFDRPARTQLSTRKADRSGKACPYDSGVVFHGASVPANSSRLTPFQLSHPGSPSRMRRTARRASIPSGARLSPLRGGGAGPQRSWTACRRFSSSI